MNKLTVTPLCDVPSKNRITLRERNTYKTRDGRKAFVITTCADGRMLVKVYSHFTTNNDETVKYHANGAYASETNASNYDIADFSFLNKTTKKRTRKKTA